MTRLLLACLALFLCSALPAQQLSIAWEPDFDQTLKAAKADGKPIMIAFIMDEEVANDAVAKNHFHDTNVVEASKSFHCLVASVGIHAATSAEGICPRFGCNTCAAHQRIQMRAQSEYLHSIRVSAPQFLFLKPDGETMLLRHVWLLSPTELVRKMKLALGFNDSAKTGDAEKRASEEVTLALKQATDLNENTRREAWRKLATLDDPRILDFLIKQTGENIEIPRRLEAIDAMGARGNANALPALVKGLRSIFPQVRNRTAISIEKLAMPEGADPIHAALKTEPNPMVKGNLVRALAVCDSQSPEHLKAIMAMIDSGPARDRAAAIRASFDIPLTDGLKKSLLAAAKDPSPGLHGAAFCALAQHQVKEAVPIIEKAIPHEAVPDVKKMAQGALSILSASDYEGPSAADLMVWLLGR